MKELKTLIKPEKEVITQDVEGYCENYFVCGGSYYTYTSCSGAFYCSSGNFSSVEEEEDILF